MDASRDPYYDRLEASTGGWFDDAHNPWPWLSYFVGIIAEAYETFAARAAAGRSEGTKQDRVREYVLRQASTSFTIAEVRRALPGISDQTIRLALWELRDAGHIHQVEAGRNAYWERSNL